MSSSTSRTIGFLGAGKMATALAKGLIARKVASPQNVIASDIGEAARDKFGKETGGTTTGENTIVLQRAEIVFIAVKPQQVASVLQEIQEVTTSRQLFISIAAGVRLKSLEAGLCEGARVVRVMPNTPCLVGAGASAFACGTNATDADSELVESLLSTVGIAMQVPESLLDAVTGLSGSGPAYVFQLIEALSDGGVRVGLPRDVATKLAAQTVYGSALMVLESGEHPAVLKDAVASPGGTTIAGLHAMEQGRVRAALMDAVRAATERSVELGRS